MNSSTEDKQPERMKTNRLNVILLKSNDSPENETNANESNRPTSSEDRYVEFLRSSNCSSSFNVVEQLNVLKFEYCNADLLYDRLRAQVLDEQISTDDAITYECLIVTSRQTVEAIERAFESRQTYSTKQSTSVQQEPLIVYCVGESTAARFNQLIDKLKAITGDEKIHERFKVKTPQVDHKLNDQVQHKHKQNSKELSKLILEDFLERNSLNKERKCKKYALYPCSSIRRDDLPTELNRAQISYDEITAYKTSKCSTAIEKLKSLFNVLLVESKTVFTTSKQTLTCLVFFSPSGVDALFEDDTIQLLIDNCHSIAFISVGPTTSGRLRKAVMTHKATINIPIYELSEPSPQALMNTLSDLFSH
jgi:uroporphyrinogen-III synthase